MLFLILTEISLFFVKTVHAFQDFCRGFAVQLQNPPSELERIWAGLLIAHVWVHGTSDAHQGGVSPLGQESVHGGAESLSQGWL